MQPTKFLRGRKKSDKTICPPAYLLALHHALHEEYPLHRTIFAEMLKPAQKARKPPFMDSKLSLPCSQELASNSSSLIYLGQYPTARKNLYNEY